jgi:mannose/cellobiose epimerase-like protein (N-acyl-D-glucosamine 2-epimerase family)
VTALAPPTAADLAAEADRLMDVARLSLADCDVWWLDEHLEIDATQGRQLWITARMAHVLSVGSLRGRSHDRDASDIALKAIDADFGDRSNGGWFPAISATGAATLTKTAYEHAFVLLAASSGVIAGVPGASSLLRRAIAIVDAHFWDETAGAMRESWDAAWTMSEPYRGANANMHAVEAFIAVADATGNDLWVERAVRIANRFIESARAHDWRLPEHYDQEWNPLLDYNAGEPRHKFRPPGATPGHALEWARLLTQLWARNHSHTALLDAATMLFDRAVQDGWDAERGGLVYTTTFDGTPLVDARFHWVHAEAVLAAEMLHRATGELTYLHWRSKFWDYTWARFPDRRNGSWHHELDRDGNPAATTWIGKPDVYHAVQACLSPELRLERSVAGSFTTLLS